jgi:hypothetical protein
MGKFARSILISAAMCFGGLAAQSADAQQMYIYPEKGQSAEQQNKDKYECSQWATGQTGFDPTQAANLYEGDSSAGRGAVVGGAAKGAVGGAVIGAIAGNAGKGAAIGAAGGGMLGAGRRGSAKKADEQKVKQSQAQYRTGLENYNRAMSTCLKGRGYSVS